MNPPALSSSASTTTQEVQLLLDAFLQDRDQARQARDALIVRAQERLRQKTEDMLGRDVPALRSRLESDDIYQAAMIRLMRALQDEAVLGRMRTACDFFRLATCQIRRELIDLARHYQRHLTTFFHELGSSDSSSGVEGKLPAGAPDPAKLAEWVEFHEQVGKLTGREADVFNLVYYEGLRFVEVAENLGVNESTVRRAWVKARTQIADRLGGLPIE